MLPVSIFLGFMVSMRELFREILSPRERAGGWGETER